jgi:3-phenylpropionate/cinnamic acid dioxygenase small subunit
MDITKEQLQDLIELKEKMAVMELQYKYVRSVDERDVKTSVNVFHNDGKLWVVDSKEKRLIGGPPEIEAFFTEIAGRDFAFARHFITNPVVKIEGDKASFRSYYNTLFIHDTLTRVVLGFYDDTLVKDKGEWKLMEKQIILGWNNNMVSLKDFIKK